MTFALHVPQIEIHGPVAFHDQCCAVRDDCKAVLDINTGIFQPSWAAQADGWYLVRAKTRLQKLALRMFWMKP